MSSKLLYPLVGTALWLALPGRAAAPPVTHAEPVKGVVTSGMLLVCVTGRVGYGSVYVCVTPITKDEPTTKLETTVSNVLPPRWNVGGGSFWVAYAQSLLDDLRCPGVRVEGDFGTDKINGKILRAEEAKVHTMLVVGGREKDAGTVAVRLHGKGSQGARPRTEAVAEILSAIKERRP